MYNLWNRIKSGISDIVKSRTFIAIIMFCVLSAVLLQRVFYLQIVKGQNYTDKYELQIQKTKEVEGTRGNIYDRNGVLLAYNELAYSVTIQDNGDYDKKSEKNKALNQIVTKVINIFDTKEVELPFTDAEYRKIVSPMIMYAITERLSCHLEKERNHPLTTRRYYRQMEY